MKCGSCNNELKINNSARYTDFSFYKCKCRESFYYLEGEEIINCIIYINKEIRFNYWAARDREVGKIDDCYDVVKFKIKVNKCSCKYIEKLINNIGELMVFA